MTSVAVGVRSAPDDEPATAVPVVPVVPVESDELVQPASATRIQSRKTRVKAKHFFIADDTGLLYFIVSIIG
jgi:hypothetical protein